jgi:predicted PhzF superfamily epimerase YddE/YHI9
MQTRAFKQIDVFGSKPLLGNPLAVVLDGQGISDAQMQQAAITQSMQRQLAIEPGQFT